MPAKSLTELDESFAASAEERFDTLLEQGGCRLERIVSRGHHSPEGFWYDQHEGELVLLVSGRARLRLQEPDETLELGPGDYIDIAAHRRHRVEWTDPAHPTIWLALFYTQAT